MSLAPWIDGPNSVNEGSSYVLQLHNDGTTAVSSWNVNWNDGSSTTVTGSATTVSHTYADGPLAPKITATATDGTNTITAPFRPYDTSFGTNGKTVTTFAANTAIPLSAVKDASGRIVVAGRAYSYVTGYDFGLARYNADGSLDTTFGSGGKVQDDLGNSDDEAYGVTLQADGKILVAGRTNDGTTGYDYVVVRYNTDGTRDSTFGSSGVVRVDFANANDYGSAIYLQSTGKIVVVGQSGSSSNGSNFGAMRLNTDGTIDTTFGDNGTGKKNIDFDGYNDSANAVAIGSDDSIYIAGKASSTSAGSYDLSITKLTADGSVDTSFATNGKAMINGGTTSDSANAIALDSSGRIVIAGTCESGTTVVRLLADGSLDSSFGSGGFGSGWSGWSGLNAVKIQSDGKIVVAGNSGDGFLVGRFNSDGSYDSTFGTSGQGRTITNSVGGITDYALVLASGGKIVTVEWARGGVNAKFALSGFTSTGSVDSTFGTNGVTMTDFLAAQDHPNAVAFDSSGRMLVAGGGAGNGSDGYIARYLDNGSLDTSYGTGGYVRLDFGTYEDTIYAIQPLSNNKVLVVGSAAMNGTTGYYARRLNADGSIDTSFGTNGLTYISFGSGTGARPNGLTLDSQGRILIAGGIWGLTGTNVGMCRLQSDGSLDSSFGTGGKSIVTIPDGFQSGTGLDSLHVDPDGHIRLIVPYSRRTIRLTSDGALDTSFGTGGYVDQTGPWGGQ